MFWFTAIAASLLVPRAHAGIGALVADGMQRGSPALERRMEELAMMRARTILAPRQDSNATFNPDGSINMTSWDAEATAACNNALSNLPAASNPSGTCICYNLPALNNVTGAFEADLRLYQLSQPTGDFAGIPPQNIQVGLSYHGASVSPVTPQTAAEKFVTRQATSSMVGTGTNSNLVLLQTYLFVGQIDASEMAGLMNEAKLEALVMPTLTLTAVNSAGQTVSTNVSSNEAAFVAGVFSTSIVMSQTALAQLAVNDLLNGLNNGTVAFVLPGVQILILPIGLIITGSWLVLSLAVYGFGTYQRISYREQYKRRIARAGKGNLGRI